VVRHAAARMDVLGWDDSHRSVHSRCGAATVGTLMDQAEVLSVRSLLSKRDEGRPFDLTGPRFAAPESLPGRIENHLCLHVRACAADASDQEPSPPLGAAPSAGSEAIVIEPIELRPPPGAVHS
jgi:hypothetical protein